MVIEELTFVSRAAAGGLDQHEGCASTATDPRVVGGPTYIQVIAENWAAYSEAYTEKLRLAWKSDGTLWAHSLHSEPIVFVMPSSVKQAHCP